MSTFANSQPHFQPQGFHQGPSAQPGNAPEVPPGWTVRWDDRYQAWFYVNVQTGVSQWEPPMPSHSPSPYHENQPATYYAEDEALARRLQAEEDAQRENAPAMPPRPQYAHPTGPPPNQHLQPPMPGAHGGGLSPGYHQPYQSHSPTHSNISLAGSASPGHSRPSSRPTSSHSYQNYGMNGNTSSHSGGGTTSQLAGAGKKLLGSSGKKKEKKHGSSASSAFKSVGKVLGEGLFGDGGDGGGGDAGRN